MADVKILKQCMVETPDEVGTLAKVLGAAKAAGTDIKGLCAYGMDGKGYFMILSGQCETACDAFKGGGWKCSWDEVVAVTIPDQIGAASELGDKLAGAGINVEYTYATSAGGGNVLVVLKTGDNAKAAEVLR